MAQGCIARMTVATCCCVLAGCSGIKRDVRYVPTPEPLVETMLTMAQVKPGDVVYDLGCGDGRIVITAAKHYGAKGVGVEIDPKLIERCQQNAAEAGVTDRVTFVNQDLFTMDFQDATVLTLYLLPKLNLRLRPQILDLKPGTRVISHAWDMGDWEADQMIGYDLEPMGNRVYLWIVPAKVEGTWTGTIKTDRGEQAVAIRLIQRYQRVQGTAMVGDEESKLRGAVLRGGNLQFVIPPGRLGATPTFVDVNLADQELRGNANSALVKHPLPNECRFRRIP